MSKHLHSTTPERIAALHAIRDLHPGDVSAPQCTRLLEGLRSFQITSFEAMRYLDVYHVPARVLQLRQQGYDIQTQWRTVQTESGTTHRVGLYVLKRGQH